MSAPTLRVRAGNSHRVRPDGRYVLYWITAFRRTRWNFALDRAVAEARRLGKPLVVCEALRCDYRWASDRLHRFALQGMAESAARFQETPVRYHPYVEPEPGAGRGLLAALAADACVVVGDDFPAFGLPRMAAAAARVVPVRLELVDANGLLPLRAAPRVFATAHAFRRFLQHELPAHLLTAPRRDPLAGLTLPRAGALADIVRQRWPAASRAMLRGDAAALRRLPLDHAVIPVPYDGGAAAGSRILARFLGERLDRYATERNHPDADAASGLSPYLHFGHVSVHEVFARLARREGWGPDRLAPRASGSKAGWWGMSAAAEAFLDELVTWRELGFNLAWQVADPDRWETLPPWAQATLSKHARDPRPSRYDQAQLAAAETHDPVWNAAQRELRTDGRIHNYLRMLWGKKILEWSRDPAEALATMIELNNKFAVDGRDPNSSSGIGWVLGRYDRPWGPERSIFGTVRYMSSANTLRKLRMQEYLRRWAR